MKKRFFSGVLLLFIIFISRSPSFALNGKHNIPNIKEGRCSACHIPHKAKGDKIWARPLNESGNAFGGIRELCESCHDGSFGTTSGLYGPEPGTNQKGVGNVFLPTEGEDHVMHGGACIEAGSYNNGKAASLRENNPDNPAEWEYKTLDTKKFPLDPEASDTMPDVPVTAHGRSNMGLNYKDCENTVKGFGGEGFYCGSCHDVHNDCVPDTANYLRYYDDDIGTDNEGVRKKFCSQCHGVPHAITKECMECHAPHRGATEMSTEDEDIARWILVEPVTETEFNTVGVIFPDSDQDKNQKSDQARLCYGCHNPTTSSYKDDIAYLDADNKYHHPMGYFAAKETNTLNDDCSPRAKGTNTVEIDPKDRIGWDGGWDANGQLNCLSCHDYHKTCEGCEEVDDNNNYLRYNFKNDSEELCLACHNDKTIDELGTPEDGHRWTTLNTSLTNRKTFKNEWKEGVVSKNCMLCHYIHDGTRTGTTKNPRESYTIIAANHDEAEIDLIPELDALMRVPAKVLPRDWADKGAESESPRPSEGKPTCYEDMCYGCHWEEEVVVIDASGDHDALLEPTKYFSHRYASDPNESLNPYHNMGNEESGKVTFPMGGAANNDDYNVKKGAMYCGSCHDVHNNSTFPYLNGKDSAYVAYSDCEQGFCQGCHQGKHAKDKEWLENTHPVCEGPEKGVTTAVFFDPSEYDDAGEVPIYSGIREGGSGKKGAVFDGMDTGGTAPILCLSCHNVHACLTNHDGTKYREWQSQSETPGVEAENGPNHGSLLVIDNNKNGEGKSDLCVQCHSM